MSRGTPSPRAAIASRATVGWMQLPPSHPWNSPDCSDHRGVAELRGAGGLPAHHHRQHEGDVLSRQVSGELQNLGSHSMFSQCFHALVVGGFVDIRERFDRP